MIEKGINDLNELEKGIVEIKGKKDREILSHIGKGIFIRTKVISEDLVVDIGKKNFVKKNIEETRAMIRKQTGRLMEMKENLNSSLEEVNSEMAKVIESIQRN
jgi:prefoldin alpha subunit